MKKTLSLIVCVVMVASFVVSPIRASAVTTNSSNELQIQLLMQLLATLQAMLAELQRGNASTNVGTGVVGEGSDNNEQGEPSIILTYPKRNVTFDKSESNDDVVIRWTADAVPENTNVIYEIKSVESYAGAFVTGSTGQIKAKSGSYEHRIAIDVPGTLDPGEYKVRLSLQECHSYGCSYSYTFGPLKEDLQTYDH